LKSRIVHLNLWLVVCPMRIHNKIHSSHAHLVPTVEVPCCCSLAPYLRVVTRCDGVSHLTRALSTTNCYGIRSTTDAPRTGTASSDANTIAFNSIHHSAQEAALFLPPLTRNSHCSAQFAECGCLRGPIQGWP
jgi:hypothetical protein